MTVLNPSFCPKDPEGTLHPTKVWNFPFSCFALFEGATMMKSRHVTDYAFSKPMLLSPQHSRIHQ